MHGDIAMKMCVRLLTLAFALVLPACADEISAPVAATKQHDQAAAEKAALEVAPPTEEQVLAANTILLRDQMAKREKMTAREVDHDREILGTLQDQRIEGITAGLPEWVQNAVANFESGSDYPAAYARSVAWGTGTYKGKPFYWFGHTNSDAWLQISLSTPLEKKDLDMIHGKKPGDLEGVSSPDRKVDAQTFEESNGFPLVIARSHIGAREGVEWVEKYCAKTQPTACDTAGALREYLLPLANSDLLGLKFEIKGIFPR